MPPFVFSFCGNYRQLLVLLKFVFLPCELFVVPNIFVKKPVVLFGNENKSSD